MAVFLYPPPRSTYRDTQARDQTVLLTSQVFLFRHLFSVSLCERKRTTAGTGVLRRRAVNLDVCPLVPFSSSLSAWDQRHDRRTQKPCKHAERSSGSLSPFITGNPLIRLTHSVTDIQMVMITGMSWKGNPLFSEEVKKLNTCQKLQLETVNYYFSFSTKKTQTK